MRVVDVTPEGLRALVSLNAELTYLRARVAVLKLTPLSAHTSAYQKSRADTRRAIRHLVLARAWLRGDMYHDVEPITREPLFPEYVARTLINAGYPPSPALMRSVKAWMYLHLRTLAGNGVQVHRWLRTLSYQKAFREEYPQLQSPAPLDPFTQGYIDYLLGDLRRRVLVSVKDGVAREHQAVFVPDATMLPPKLLARCVEDCRKFTTEQAALLDVFANLPHGALPRLNAGGYFGRTRNDHDSCAFHPWSPLLGQAAWEFGKFSFALGEIRLTLADIP